MSGVCKWTRAQYSDIIVMLKWEMTIMPEMFWLLSLVLSSSVPWILLMAHLCQPLGMYLHSSRLTCHSHKCNQLTREDMCRTQLRLIYTAISTWATVCGSPRVWAVHLHHVLYSHHKRPPAWTGCCLRPSLRNLWRDTCNCSQPMCSSPSDMQLTKIEDSLSTLG